MNKTEYVEAANTELVTQVTGKNSQKSFSVREFTYGVLVPDEDHPLSCVSVANSSLSVDLWIGCKWQCAYCQVQGSKQDLADNGAMPSEPRKRTRFSVGEIVESLLQHPFFVKDETVISIGTASTEPFASGQVQQSTFDLMEAFIKKRLRNPFWIVTKSGIPKGRKQEFARIVKETKGLMVSLCWADNPRHIEPIKNNRFLNIEEAKEAGVTLSWYMRPLTPEWSGTSEQIEMMMLWVKEHYASYLSAIVPGGLRWTEGIEYGLTEVHQKPFPAMLKKDNEKDLPQDLAETIIKLARSHLPSIPLYFKSSCAITHMLKRPSISSVQILSRYECEMSSCPLDQRHRCGGGSICSKTKQDVQNTIDAFGIPTRVIGWSPQNAELVTEPPLDSFTYALRQAVINNLGND